MTHSRQLLVGIGSGYGDDQAGWRIADAVLDLARPSLTIKQARSPADLLDSLAGVTRLHLCDACSGAGAIGSWYRWRWPTAEIQPVHFSGSHDLGLATVLALSEQLGQLPPEVIIWGIEGRRAHGPEPFLEPNMSLEVEQAVTEVTARIRAELSPEY